MATAPALRPQQLRRRRRDRRAGVAVAVVLAAVVSQLNTCSGLPERSEVQRGLEIGAPVLPPLRVRFDAPRAGAPPTEIVRSFLAAGVELEDRSQAARAYLTSEAAREWDPRDRVVVYAEDQRPTVSVVNPSTVQIGVPVQAVIDRNGRYLEHPADSRITDVVRVAKAGGEWRISQLPKGFGRWMSAGYAGRLMTPVRIHYLSTTDRTLVSDVRSMPLDVASLPTTLAKAQLREVPGYLADAARSGFPGGTELAVDAVSLASGVAKVDVSSRVMNETAEDLRGGWAQMLATLSDAPGVNRVALLVDGKSIELSGVASPAQSLVDLGYQLPPVPGRGTLVTRAEGRLNRTDAATLRAAVEQSPTNDATVSWMPALSREWTDLAGDVGLREFAAVDAGRAVLQRWRVDDPLIRDTRLGTGLTAPAYDATGVLWVAALSPQGRPVVWAMPAESSTDITPRPVATPWLTTGRVVAIRIAADGQRAVVVTRRPNGRVTLGLSGVVRDRAGMPVRLNPPITIGGSLVDATDITWVDDLTVAVVGRRAGDRALRPVLVPLARPATPLASVADPVRIISTGAGVRGLMVLTAAGTLMAPAGSQWKLMSRAEGITVPGT